jgi:hypothetical protein
MSAAVLLAAAAIPPASADEAQPGAAVAASAPSMQASLDRAEIAIDNFTFGPAELTVTVGTTVTWATMWPCDACWDKAVNDPEGHCGSQARNERFGRKPNLASATEVAVVGAKVFEVLDGAEEIVGHRAPHMPTALERNWATASSERLPTYLCNTSLAANGAAAHVQNPVEPRA